MTQVTQAATMDNMKRGRRPVQVRLKHTETGTRRTPPSPPNADGTSVSVSMSLPAAEAVARSGEIRNGFAPGTDGVAETGSSFADRRKAEKHIFGVSEDADHTQRPIYAWLRRSDSTEQPFGDAVLDLSLNGRRVTTTEGDSLMRHTRSKVNITYDPHYQPRDIDEAAAAYIKAEDLTPSHAPIEHDSIARRINPRLPEYREVQVHDGPVPVSSITKATLYRTQHFSDGIESARDALRGAGVPTQVMSYGEYQPTLSREMFGEGKTGWFDEEAYR